MSRQDQSGENGYPARITRRDFLRIGGLTMLGSVLAACGGAAPATPDTGGAAAPTAAGAAAPAASTGAKQTVRYLSWWFEEGNRGKTWNAFIKEFNDSQKDIEIKAENIPFDAYTTKTIDPVVWRASMSACARGASHKS